MNEKIAIDLHERCILITGGSLGIGRACAQVCLRAGASVVIAARDEEQLLAAQQQLGGDGCEARIDGRRADVSQANDVADVFAFAMRRFGRLDGVIHAAAVLGPIGPFDEIEPEHWWNVVRINLFGSFLVLRQAAQHFRAQGGGRVVAFSGGGAGGPFPRFTGYAASKVALVRLVETIAIELAPFGVELNCVGPGFVATRMHEETLAAGADAASADYFDRTKAELERGGTSPLVGANVAAFLVSDAARGISGKFVAAPYDEVAKWPQHLAELHDSDIFTLRRIVPRDRGMAWQ